MDAMTLNAVLGTVSILLIAIYNLYLTQIVRLTPGKTVYGLASSARRVWVASIMLRKRDILAVQTLRNWIMAASMLASTSVIIIFGFVAFLSTVVSHNDTTDATTNPLAFTFFFVLDGLFPLKVDGRGHLVVDWSLKAVPRRTLPQFVFVTVFSLYAHNPTSAYPQQVLLLLFAYCFAFICFAQAMRFFNHVGLVINVNLSDSELRAVNSRNEVCYTGVTPKVVGDMLNRDCSFPLLCYLWGPWFLLGASVLLVIFLRVLDFNVDKTESISFSTHRKKHDDPELGRSDCGGSASADGSRPSSTDQPGSVRTGVDRGTGSSVEREDSVASAATRGKEGADAVVQVWH
ncbi:hypothetical protein HK101_010383 [Irineochytrium annulatum]|nr:hypothetical protein HK101_010383 [Irineochytrium annulatum]